MATSNPQSGSPSSDCGWTPCQGGEIRSLVGMLKKRCRNRRCAKVAAAGFIVLLGVAVYSGAIPGVGIPAGAGGNELAQPNEVQKDSRHGGIACSEVKRLAEDYLHGALSKLQEHQIHVHLQNCPRCQEHIDALRPAPVSGVHEFPGQQMVMAPVISVAAQR